MKNIIPVLLLSALFSSQAMSQTDSTWLQEIRAFREEMNHDFADSLHSPLPEEARRGFTGLEFFPADSTFRVIAKWRHTPGEEPFKMKTTTDRTPEYVKYGEVEFSLGGRSIKLSVYRNLELMKRDGFEDYLFLPFYDKTNGHESYGGGRYLDLRIPEGDSIVLDFNKAYNPYCAYNDQYSCPIPPVENTLLLEIKAGVMAPEKH